MRRVKYFERQYIGHDGKFTNPNYKIVEIGEADFHGFGVDYEEFESGAGNFSTAIIELDSGDVISIRADRIKFIKEESSGFGLPAPNLEFLSVRGK